MTIRSEIIALLDAIPSLASRNYADERPPDEPLPHTVLLDQISLAPVLSGDGRVIYWRHVCQLDLWEDAAAADETTRDAVVNALDGASINGALRLRVEAADRVYEPDRRLAHTAITLGAARPR